MNTKEKVLIHKGIDKFKRMEFADALQIFDLVLSQNPKIPEAWNNRGVTLFRLGRYEEALESYDRSLSIDPLNLEALRNKGFVLRNLGRLDESLNNYEIVIREGGEAIDLESKASLLAAMDRLEEALDCMLQAVEIMPMERFEEEIELLKDTIQRRNRVAEVMNNMKEDN